MTKQRGNSESGDSASSYTLTVTFHGLFVFVYGSTQNTIEVYAPACGHMYGAGYSAKDGMVMLDRHRHCLEILQRAPNKTDKQSSNLFPDANDYSEMRKNNLVAGVRPIQQGWDLQLSLPTPLAGRVQSSLQVFLDLKTKTPVFTGTNCGELFKGDQMSLKQVFSYDQVTRARLSGSCLDDLKPSMATDGKVIDLMITAEPVFSPSYGHQQHAARALAALLGVDMVLARPLPRPLYAMAGNCMGGGYVGGPPK